MAHSMPFWQTQARLARALDQADRPARPDRRARRRLARPLRRVRRAAFRISVDRASPSRYAQRVRLAPCRGQGAVPRRPALDRLGSRQPGDAPVRRYDTATGSVSRQDDSGHARRARGRMQLRARGRARAPLRTSARRRPGVPGASGRLRSHDVARARDRRAAGRAARPRHAVRPGDARSGAPGSGDTV